MKKNKFISMFIIFAMVVTTVLPLQNIYAVEDDNNVNKTYTNDLEEIKSLEISEDEYDNFNGLKLDKTCSPATFYSFSTNSYGSLYGYNKLDSDNKKAAYQNMLYASELFQNSSEDAQLVNGYYPAVGFDASSYGLTVDEMFRVYLTFYYDNPMYYWLDAISYSYNKSNNVVTKVILCCKEDYKLASTRINLNETIESYIEAYLNFVSPMSNDFEKELRIHDALIYNNDYALDLSGNPETSSYAHNIVGVFDDDKNTMPVCEGYAKAFSLLCNASGIDCGFIVGDAGGGHAWNQIKLDNQWYNVDVTWDDAGTTKKPNTNAYYPYFNRTDKEFLKEHTPFLPTGQGAYWCYSTYSCTATKYSIENQEDNLPQTIDLHTVTYDSTEDLPMCIFNQGVEVPSTSEVLTGTKLSIMVLSKRSDLAEYYDIDVNGKRLTLTKNSEPNSNGYIQYIANYIAIAEDMTFSVVEKSDSEFDLILNKNNITFTTKNAKDTLVTKFKGKVVDNSTLTFTSDNIYAARVDANGNIIVTGSGIANIKVRSEALDKEVTCKVFCNVPFLRGDIDDNGEVEIADAYCMLRFVVNRLDYETPEASMLPAANFDNNDDLIDISDAYSLLRYIVNNT